MITEIITYSGKRVNPLKMVREDIDIRDIAHALSLMPRFAGHTKFPISIAQHSLAVVKIVHNWAGDKSPQILLQALVHDASEAYLCDIPKLVKASPEFVGYCEAEDRLQRLIYVSMGCQEEMHWMVDQADQIAVRLEAAASWGEDFMLNPEYPPISYEELHNFGLPQEYDWRDVEQAFLLQYRTLQHAFTALN